MMPADNINSLIKKLQLKASADLDKRVREDITRALFKSKKEQSAQTRPIIGRIIMRSTIIKLSVAAAVIIACLIGLSFWMATGSGIALADVLAEIEKVGAYRHECNSTLTNLKEPNNPLKWHGTMLKSQKYGYKTILADPNDGIYYFSIQEKTLFTIWPKQKKYELLYLNDAEKHTLLTQSLYNYYAGDIVKKILGCKYESMGRLIVDGTEVEGFRTTDPSYESTTDPNHVSVDVKIWVDLKTQLPVRTEELITKGKSIWHFTTHNYQWDIPVNATEFKPLIPDDYTRVEFGFEVFDK